MHVFVDSSEPHLAVVHLNGRLTMVSKHLFVEAVASTISSGVTRLVVDLSRVESIDIRGLGALFYARNAVRAFGGDIRLASPNEQVRSVLRITTAEILLPLVDVPTDALVAY